MIPLFKFVALGIASLSGTVIDHPSIKAITKLAIMFGMQLMSVPDLIDFIAGSERVFRVFEHDQKSFILFDVLLSEVMG